MYGHTSSKSMDQKGKVVNPARGQPNSRENEYFPVRVRALEFGLARGLGSPVPRQPAHLNTQAESGAYLRDSSRVSRWRLFIYLNRRHRACKPQGSSKLVLPWQVIMDQLICASISHTHYYYYYWYEEVVMVY